MAFAESKLESPCEELGPESNAEELYRMGLVYSTGLGVSVDYITAHKWFNLAALRGYSEAKSSRKELAEYMSTEEIAAAQKAAREWLSLAN
jgi:TPR repeat protein